MSAISVLRARAAVLFAATALLALSAFAAPTDAEGLAALEATQVGFRAIHRKVGPAVVSITTRVAATTSDPMEWFFGSPSTPRVRSASGSGVIIRSEGIVITNSHVVKDATKVTVTLADSEKELPAEVVQTDPRTDLAIVRITEKGTYPTAGLGDSGTVSAGDWAIAFGNPFRLASTMTVGTISATGRKLRGPERDFNYTDLIQTDAPINPGNSGGPLVNIRGEVIGINFMIYSPGDAGGSVGIGFAIPISAYTRDVIETLITGKSIERGRLGISVKNLDDAMREAFGVKEGGIFVDDVVAGGAAAKAGIKAEDIITSYNGVAVNGIDEFVQLVERTKPGTEVALAIVREKKEMTIKAIVAAAPVATVAALDDRKAGLSVVTLTTELATRYGLSAASGVLVMQVVDGMPASDAGLARGDVISRVGSQDVRSADDFWTALSDAMTASKVGVLIRVQRGNRRMTLTMPQIAAE